MPFSFNKISQLNKKDSADKDDLLSVSSKEGTSYQSNSLSVGSVTDYAVTTETYDDLATDDKTIIGAINEATQEHTTITVDQVVTSGDHIADITVEGNTTEIYAPEIFANQLAQTTGDLNNLKIGDKIYAINRPIIYGFHIDGSESNPSSKVIYLEDSIGMTPAHMDYTNDTFDYGSWENTFILNIKPCILNPNGEVVRYLDKNDYSKDIDGNSVPITQAEMDSDPSSEFYHGNVMIEFPKLYMKIVPDHNDSTSASVYLSDQQVDSDYKDYSYISPTLANKDHIYLPAYNYSGNDSLLRSVSDAQYYLGSTMTTEMTAWGANGTDYHLTTLSELNLISAILILISKSTDCQTSFGMGLTTNGGVSADVNNGYRTGQQNQKGLFYGTNSGEATVYTNAVKVLGIENLWGFTYRRYLGHVISNGTHLYKLCFGQSDGSTTDNYNTDGTGYISSSVTYSGTSGNYITGYTFLADNFLPTTLTGTSSTYYCDSNYYDNTGLKTPLFGGNSNIGYNCGIFHKNLLNDSNFPKIAYATKTATPIITLSDALNANVNSLKIGITPVQTGTGAPSPTNVRPIVGWSSADLNVAGKNLCSLEYVTASGANYKGLTSNAVTIYSNISTGSFKSVRFKIFDVAGFAGRSLTISITPNQTVGPSVPRIICRLYDGTTNVRTYFEVTSSETFSRTIQLSSAVTDTMSLQLVLYCDSGDGSPSECVYSNIQLELGSNATAYESYNRNTHTISWQNEVGTIYGGELDVVNRVLRATKAYNILRDTDSLASGGAGIIWYRPSDVIIPTQSLAEYVMSSHYRSTIQSIGSGADIVIFKTINNSVIVIRDSANAQTLQDFKDYIEGQYNNGTPVEVAYTLATPIEYTLTPTQIQTLLGYNTIYANTGDILELSYQRDLTLSTNKLN